MLRSWFVLIVPSLAMGDFSAALDWAFTLKGRSVIEAFIDVES